MQVSSPPVQSALCVRMVRSGTFRKSRVHQDLLQLDFGLPGHPQSRHVETFVVTEATLRLLSVNPEQNNKCSQTRRFREKTTPPVTRVAEVFCNFTALYVNFTIFLI